MAQVQQKLTRVKKESLRVGSGPPRNCSGWVGLAETASGRVLTQPIPNHDLVELASTFSTRFALDRLFMSTESESNWAQIFLQMAKKYLMMAMSFKSNDYVLLLGLRNF